jgi:HD-GYP domain-containing protein (c-di-GMP phosphodiesterase class II)
MAPFLSSSPTVLRIVRSHHERMDGSGFPDSLKGADIPIEARIIAVVDAFDAMTTNRAYRQPRTAAEAIAELLRYSGVQFDAEVVQAFLKAHDDGAALPLTS